MSNAPADTPPPRNALAIALAYEHPSEGPSRAPKVVAVGRGLIGDRIIETARAHGVPLREDPALAEALAAVPLDTEIPEALYRAVAVVISYVLTANGRLKPPQP